MADPNPYDVTYSFSGYQATNPASPLPAGPIDNEFANIEEAIGELVDAVKDVRRSDGALPNGIVTREALSEEVYDLAGASAYAVAVENGFEGTEVEWLASLGGTAATVTVGTVTTLAAGASVTVTNVGTAMAAILNFGIPRGDPGAAGAGSGDMLAATYDPTAVAGDAFLMSNMVETTSAKVMTSSERTKLASVASGATANSTDAALRARSSHTGTQTAATISDFSTAADARISNAITGNVVQGYSAALAGTQQSFTTALKSKLDGVDAGATANDTDANLKREYIVLAASDETTALTVGTGKVRFRMPHAMTLTAVRASLTTTQSSGSTFTVDINENGTSILSTKLTIDNTEKTSTSAASPAVISDTALADDSEITVDIDQVGNGTATGLKVTLIGVRP